MIEDALHSTNRLFETLTEASPYVYRLLGMRNLSAFVGEAYGSELAAASGRLLILNPHQDGYPDLLQMDSPGLQQLEISPPREKAPFSPFPTGGIEVKATCGDVPSAKQLASRGLEKPDLGDTRIKLISGITWKAHHRETNHLIGILWDFIDGLPTITAVAYADDLCEEDWGEIITPKKGGGRTTSVSIMKKSGVQKMCRNPVALLEGPYTRLIQKKAN